MKRFLVKILVLYVAYAVIMVLAHPRFIYPFGATPFDGQGWRKEVVSSTEVPVVIAEGKENLAVLFFMGNGGALAYFEPILDLHRQAGRTVAALEYRGGGGVPGTPSEQQLKADALVAYDWLAAQHSGPIVVHGYSLGTGLALHVAAHRDVVGVVLDAPYLRMCELMSRQSFLPACYLPGVQRWASSELVPQVYAPVLVQHGLADELIPVTHGERLSDLLAKAGREVSFYPLKGATHSSIISHPRYHPNVNGFMDRLSK